MKTTRSLLVCLLAALLPVGARAQTPPSPVPDGGAVRSDPTLRFTGTFESRAELKLQAQVSGRLVTVGFREGSAFKSGDVLAELDPADYEIALAEAQAILDGAEARLAAMEAGGRVQERDRAAADLASAQAVHRNARSNLEIVEGLHGTGGVSKQSVDAARREVEVAAARVVAAERSLSLVRQGPRAEDKRGARAEVDRARASVRRANLRLADTKVRAPFPGTVMQKLVVEGTNVTGGSPQGTTLCVFADISVLRALVDVPEGDLPRVRAGQEARVFVRAHPARAFAGRVTNVFPFVDARSRNGKVEIEVPNAAADLVPGMFVKVEIDPTTIQASKPTGSGTGRI